MEAKKLFGPDSTPDVKTESAPAWRRASGRDRPTHFSRTQSGASPGGADVMRRREAGMPEVDGTILSFGRERPR